MHQKETFDQSPGRGEGTLSEAFLGHQKHENSHRTLYMPTETRHRRTQTRAGTLADGLMSVACMSVFASGELSKPRVEIITVRQCGAGQELTVPQTPRRALWTSCQRGACARPGSRRCWPGGLELQPPASRVPGVFPQPLCACPQVTPRRRFAAVLLGPRGRETSLGSPPGLDLTSPAPQPSPGVAPAGVASHFSPQEFPRQLLQLVENPAAKDTSGQEGRRAVWSAVSGPSPRGALGGT